MNVTQNLTTYQKWEPLIDATTFIGSTAFVMAGSVGPLAASTITIIGVNSFTDNKSKLLRLSLSIAVLALNLLAISFLFSPYTLPLIVSLTLEKTTSILLFNVAAKIACYALFQSTLRAHDLLTFEPRLDPKLIRKCSLHELHALRRHHLNFPEKEPLYLQLTLNKTLQAHNLPRLPLRPFPEITFTTKLLEEIHTQDLSRLSDQLQARLATCFFEEDLPPQDRPYTPSQLPKFLKLPVEPTPAKAKWYALCLEKRISTPLHLKWLQKLYDLDLPPSNDLHIDLPLPQTQQQVFELSPAKLKWFANLFKASPAKRNMQSAAIQLAFDNMLEKKNIS